jgi:hypothetical protein
MKGGILWHISLPAAASNAENAKKNVPRTQFTRPADNMPLFREDVSNAENAQKSARLVHRRKKKKDNFSGRDFLPVFYIAF